METIKIAIENGKAVYVKEMPIDSNGIVVKNYPNVQDLITILINKGLLKAEDLVL